MQPMETIQASFDHVLRENPMGEARKDPLRLDFDRRLKCFGAFLAGVWTLLTVKTR